VPGDPTADLQLTTAWNVNAAYEHFWNPRWRTSLYGGYAAISYNEIGNALICTFGDTTPQTTCNNNWSAWWLGSRTQWNVTKDFYLGMDVMYAKLHSADFGGLPGSAITSSGAVAPKTDPDNWQFRFRVHRDFYP
jgi:hypothetical protein